MLDERPAVLTAVAIIGIVLGALGVLGSLFSIVALVFQGDITALQPPAGMPASQQQLSAELREMSSAYAVPGTIGVLADLGVCIFLILGGALLLARKRVAAGMMMKVAIAALVVDLYNTALGWLAQLKTLPLMQDAMRTAVASTPAGAPQLDSMMSVALWVGTAWTALWLLCKLAYYIVTIVALKRPAVAGWLAERAPA